MRKSTKSLSGRGSHVRSSVGNISNLSNTNRIVPPPINIPTRDHKSILIDDFEKVSIQKKITKQDYYEEIRKRPIKVLMTREISQYYGRETYLKTTIKEILIYIIFLLILSMLVLEIPSSDMKMLTTAMTNKYTEREFTDEGVSLKYKDINRIRHIWLYLEALMNYLEDDLFFINSNDPRVSDEETITSYSLHETRVIGVPRIRIVRVNNRSCKVVEEFKNEYETCFSFFSLAEEETQPFGKMDGPAWRYSTSEQTGLHSVYGSVSVYGGGGYYQDCPRHSKKESLNVLTDLREHKWIDNGTRAVVVDFTSYNANVNLFCIVKLLFEIPPTGGVIPSFIIHTIRLIGYGDKQIVMVGCTIVFVCFFVFYTIEELYEMTYFKWMFIKSFWNFLDVLIVLMCYLVIVTNLYQYVTANAMLSTINLTEATFLNFDQMLYVQIVCNISMSLLILFCWLKVLKYVGINHSMYLLQATFQLAFPHLIWYTLIFSTVFINFALTFSSLFGDQIKIYSTLFESVWTLLRAGVGDFDYALIEHRRPILGPLFFLLYQYLFCYVLVVIYIAILLEIYAEVRSEISINTAQIKLGDILQSWLVDIIESFSHKLATRTKDSYNRRKLKHKFQDVRYLLLRCGFTELEINMFLAKYEISEDRIMTEEDLRDVMLGLQSKGTTQLGLASEIVRQTVSEKLAVLEEALSNAESKIDLIVEVLDVIEAKISLRQ